MCVVLVVFLCFLTIFANQFDYVSQKSREREKKTMWRFVFLVQHHQHTAVSFSHARDHYSKLDYCCRRHRCRCCCCCVCPFTENIHVLRALTKIYYVTVSMHFVQFIISIHFVLFYYLIVCFFFLLLFRLFLSCIEKKIYLLFWMVRHLIQSKNQK